MASNIEIIKDVFRETTLFNGVIVSHPLIEREVKIVTKASFVRMSDLASLKLFIEQKGGKVEDVKVCPAGLGETLSVVVVFNR